MRRRRDGNIGEQPWFQPPKPVTAREVVVLGAGVAGAAAAFSLAEAGFSVRVFDRRAEPAQETSAHAGAVVMPIISLAPAPVSNYHVAAYERTLARLDLLQARGLDPGRRDTGVVHLLTKGRLEKLYDGLGRAGYSDQIVQALPPDAVAEVTGLPLREPALYFPRAGWVHAPSYVAAQLNHPRITFTGETEVGAIKFEEGSWRLYDAAGALITETPLLVLAAAADCVRFPHCDWFPLIRIRGQLAYVAEEHCRWTPKTVICHDGYMIPGTQAGHLMGATFDYDRTDTELDRADFENLVQRNHELLGMDLAVAQMRLRGRVAFRSKCHDHLPMVGAVPDYDATMNHYGDITKGRAYKDYPSAAYVPNLFVTTGHGSRGMISSVMAAEVLTAQMLGQTPPLDAELNAAIHPARFMIRRLLRRQPPLRDDNSRSQGDSAQNEWR